ncbi:MAG: alpha-hydroxy acid oxidase [Gammaproteobacteria bacterium]
MNSRREFAKLLLGSPLLVAGPLRQALAYPDRIHPETLKQVLNVFHLDQVARQKLPAPVYHYIVDGAADQRTIKANRDAFEDWAIRVRRLVDVSNVDTSLKLFGDKLASPIVLAPVGAQNSYNEQAELASARAAAPDHVFIAPTLGSFSIEEIRAENPDPMWFQLYTFTDRNIMKRLIDNSIATGYQTLVVTIDGPHRGRHESQLWFRSIGERDPTPVRMGNFPQLKDLSKLGDPSLTWEFVDWLKQNTTQNIVLKGIVTGEDAKLCLQYGVDGIIVSNHGGRHEDSSRATLSSLPEVIDAVDGHMPVLIDGGFRRGSDIFKALALGADAVCIGRPYIWGLGAFGEDGVRKCLQMLDAELKLEMMFAGTPALKDIQTDFVTAA